MAFEKGLVSVLICTYNAEETIWSTLKSCLNQTYKNFEILIHDDQSKDKTLDIINNIGDNRIKVIESGKKLGPYKGLNFLLDHAKGEYVAIQDHDDIRHPEKLKEQILVLQDNPEYVGCGTACLWYFKSKESGMLYDIKGGVSTFCVTHTSIMFRNSGKRYDTTSDYLADAYFQKRILSENNKKILILPQVLTLHYSKGNGENYSDNRFKINKENMKRFFYVHGIGIYSIGLFLYMCLVKILGKKIKQKIDSFLLLKRYKGIDKETLMKNRDTKILLEYLG